MFVNFIKMFVPSSNVRVFVLKALCFNRVHSKCIYSLTKQLQYSIIYPFELHRFFITSHNIKNLHSTKGWKSIARDGHKIEYSPDKFTACEEGTGAVPHDVLLSKLQDCNSVSDQIKTFCSIVSITSKDVENRKEFCKSLEEIIRLYLPDMKLHLFGSSMNGLGFRGCDADVSIQTLFGDKDFVTNVKEPPTLDSVIKGETSADTVASLPPRHLLRFVRRILRAHCSDIPEPILLIKARCPLLRFYNAKYDVFCDFSCENYSSLRNTKLIRFLCHLDERFSSLAKIIRYWGKHGGFVGDIDLFNSYSFSLLIVHFLQLKNPPVLPPVKEIIEKTEYVTNGDLDDDELFFRDLKKFSPSQNSQTVEELLKEYFFHFLTFDDSLMMLPLSSSYMPVDEFVPKNIPGSDYFEFSPIIVQDPFRLNYNVTAGAKKRACKGFMNGLVEACKAYQDDEIWNPSTKKWGLATLFQRPVQEMSKRWQSNTVTIKLPLKIDISLLTQIFQEALLFDCNELFIDDDKKGPRPSLRLMCKVHHTTWVGREFIHANHPQTLNNPIEIEKWVSNQILKNKEKGKNQLLFTFLCECFENKSNNELDVVLTFKESRFPRVPIYLKEYIPSLLRKLVM